jgi:CHAD domain-containing protein
MINIGITWYFGRAINDIRNVEKKLRAEEDTNMLRDMRVKLDKLRVKYDLLNS